jgi:hypothetical protein
MPATIDGEPADGSVDKSDEPSATVQKMESLLGECAESSDESPDAIDIAARAAELAGLVDEMLASIDEDEVIRMRRVATDSDWDEQELDFVNELCRSPESSESQTAEAAPSINEQSSSHSLDSSSTGRLESTTLADFENTETGDENDCSVNGSLPGSSAALAAGHSNSEAGTDKAVAVICSCGHVVKAHDSHGWLGSRGSLAGNQASPSLTDVSPAEEELHFLLQHLRETQERAQRNGNA